MGAEAGEAEDDLSARVLRERLLDRLGEVVGGRAGGLQLDSAPGSLPRSVTTDSGSPTLAG
jgi:hypothetical protein